MFTNGISTGELSHNYQVAQLCIGANFFCSDPDKQDKDIGLVQDCSIPITNALDILQSCTKPRYKKC